MNTATTKTVEQLKQEAEAAARALAEAQEAAREAEQQAKAAEEKKKRDAEEKVMADKMARALRPVYIAMNAAGIKCEIVGLCIMVKPDVPDLRVGVEQEYRSSGSGFHAHSSATGRLLITVGDTLRNMPKLRYPQLKNGGHNVEKIVKAVQERIAIRNAVVKRNQIEQQQKEAAGGLAAKVVRTLKLKADTSLVCGNYNSGHYTTRGRYESRTYTASEGKVFVRLGTYEVTPEQAAILIKGVRDANIFDDL